MVSIHLLLFYVHIIAGSMALCLFWLPAFMKKGSLNHVQFGRYYARTMYVVVLSGSLMALIVLAVPLSIKGHLLKEGMDPEAFVTSIRLFWAFLLYLSLLTYVAVRQGVEVVRAKHALSQLKRLTHVAPAFLVLIAGIALLIVGLQRSSTLYILFGIFGPVLAIQHLRFCFRASHSSKAWVVEHFSSLIGSGIGAHTAFIAFGGRYLFEGLGQWQLLFWVAPGVIGSVVISRLARRYNTVSIAG
ncbi:hypothetical protein [Aestuariibacter salexigens]|uniref:hypothetical protein n=1 Tax=Aestuariibacter salexigens TaxID=226010 RepID=UPI00040A8D51|nr:hypothetical protein [Aestuariibacter salexigens]